MLICSQSYLEKNFALFWGGTSTCPRGSNHCPVRESNQRLRFLKLKTNETANHIRRYSTGSVKWVVESVITQPHKVRTSVCENGCLLHRPLRYASNLFLAKELPLLHLLIKFRPLELLLHKNTNLVPWFVEYEYASFHIDFSHFDELMTFLTCNGEGVQRCTFIVSLWRLHKTKSMGGGAISKLMAETWKPNAKIRNITSHYPNFFDTGDSRWLHDILPEWSFPSPVSLWFLCPYRQLYQR